MNGLGIRRQPPDLFNYLVDRLDLFNRKRPPLVFSYALRIDFLTCFDCSGAICGVMLSKKRTKSARGTEFVIMTEDRPLLDVVAVDVREIVFSRGIPVGIDALIPIERTRKQRSSLAPIYEAI